jgi:hypothetical protein
MICVFEKVLCALCGSSEWNERARDVKSEELSLV